MRMHSCSTTVVSRTQPNKRGGGQTGSWSDKYECRLWKTNEIRSEGGWWPQFTLRDIWWVSGTAVMGNACYNVRQYIHARKKKRSLKSNTASFLKRSLISFGLLEQTIKAMLSCMHHRNPEPQVFMLCKTGLTISHVKQLPAYVTFFSLSQQFCFGGAVHYWISSI